MTVLPGAIRDNEAAHRAKARDGLRQLDRSNKFSEVGKMKVTAGESNAWVRNGREGET